MAQGEQLDVMILTTVFGNSRTDVVTRNALTLSEIAGPTDIPVTAGVTSVRRWERVAVIELESARLGR